MRFGPAIDEALLQLRLSQQGWQHRGDPCGLLLGVGEPLEYENVPDEFRAFLTWGVDGVHEGLWIDDMNQDHPPCVVMASPMDLDGPIRLEAANVEEWLVLVERDRAGPETNASDREEAARRAAEYRASLGLPPIPTGERA